jgi:nitrate reductase NapE component
MLYCVLNGLKMFVKKMQRYYRASVLIFPFEATSKIRKHTSLFFALFPIIQVTLIYSYTFQNYISSS